MAALIAGNFEGDPRKVAYAVIGGVAGAGIAIGPILGGWATTELSWRVVFAGEVVLVAVHPGHDPQVADAPIEGAKPTLDFVGSVLAASRAGRRRPRDAAVEHLGLDRAQDSPIEPFGFSLTLFVIAFGGVLLWAFVRWQRRREAPGRTRWSTSTCSRSRRCAPA